MTSHVSSKINPFCRSTCSSTCRTCPAHRPSSWNLCPRPFASCLKPVRKDAQVSINNAINKCRAPIPNLNFYLHLRLGETAAHLAQLISVLISVANSSCRLFITISFDFLQDHIHLQNIHWDKLKIFFDEMKKIVGEEFLYR